MLWYDKQIMISMQQYWRISSETIMKSVMYVLFSESILSVQLVLDNLLLLLHYVLIYTCAVDFHWKAKEKISNCKKSFKNYFHFHFC